MSECLSGKADCPGPEAVVGKCIDCFQVAAERLQKKLHVDQHKTIEELERKLVKASRQIDGLLFAVEEGDRKLKEANLQVRELQDLLWEIGNKDVSEPFSRDDAMKILKLLNKTKYREKRVEEKMPESCYRCGAPVMSTHSLCGSCKHTSRG